MISLVFCTVGRLEEVERFLESLLKQTYTDYELIIIDQNDDDRLKNIIGKLKSEIKMDYHKVAFRGLSRARNFGLRFIKGDIIGFPDDDCVYESNTLQLVADAFTSYKIDVLTGKEVGLDFHKKNMMSQAKPLTLNIYNIWKHSISFTVFLNKDAITNIGLFDENLGVGAGTPYGSGEETDYLIRGIRRGFYMVHIDTLFVRHPKVDFTGRNISKKFYDYSFGRMKVLQKNRYGNWFVLLNILWPLLKVLLSLRDENKRRVFWQQFKGRYDFYRREMY